MVDILKMAGFDDAIIGIQENIQPKIVYDLWKMVEILNEEGMSTEDALDHIGYNITSTYVGETTPIIVDTKKTLEDIVSM
jgi:hypothetical protein